MGKNETALPADREPCLSRGEETATGSVLYWSAAVNAFTGGH